MLLTNFGSGSGARSPRACVRKSRELDATRCATADFNMVDDARKAAIADADKIGAADSIIIDPIGERWVKGDALGKNGQRVGTRP